MDEPQPELAPHTIDPGDLLKTGARAVGQNFLTFLSITVLLHVPAFAMEVGFEEWLVMQSQRMLEADPYGPGQQSLQLTTSFGVLGLRIVQIIFLNLAQAALMYATVEFLAGRKAGIGESLTGGLSRLHVVLAVAFLYALAVGLGTCACIIPGILLACVLYVAIPAAVCEKLGPIEAMQRSSDLTSGHRLTIFLVLLLMFVIEVGLTCGISVGYGDNLFDQDAYVPPLSAPVRASRYALAFGMQCVLAMFTAAFASVFYARVRGIRDGVDANAIADVFA